MYNIVSSPINKILLTYYYFLHICHCKILMTFTKYTSLFSFTFFSLLLIPNNQKIIAISFYLLLTFIPFQFIPFTFFYQPNNIVSFNHIILCVAFEMLIFNVSKGNFNKKSLMINNKQFEIYKFSK